MTLFVGDVLGGPELGATKSVGVLRTIRKAAVKLRNESGGLIEQGSLDLVFHFPGAVSEPDFAGIRTAKFSRKRQMLMVQVAVPTRIVQSPDYQFFFDSMRSAVQLAAPVFARAGIPFHPHEYIQFIHQVEQETGYESAVTVQ